MPGHPTSDMRPISAAHKENIISLASHGHSTCYIASHTGISQPTVSRVLKNILPDQQTPQLGRPSKLSPTVTTRYGLLHYDYLIRQTGPFVSFIQPT